MKFKVLKSFRITLELLEMYVNTVEGVRAKTPPGQFKPTAGVPAWLTIGAVYLAGDTIEVTPVEAAELKVVAPSGALEEVHG